MPAETVLQDTPDHMFHLNVSPAVNSVLGMPDAHVGDERIFTASRVENLSAAVPCATVGGRSEACDEGFTTLSFSSADASLAAPTRDFSPTLSHSAADVRLDVP